MLDRDVDLVSPFCIQQTYEGQVDETLGLSMGKAKVHRSVIDSYYNQTISDLPPMAEIEFNSSDPIYSEIRYKPYEALGFYFQVKTQQLTQTVQSQQFAQNDLQAIKESVRKIREANIAGTKPLLDLHTNICSHIKSHNKEVDMRHCRKLE